MQSQESLVNEKSLKEMCYTLFFWIYLAVTGLSYEIISMQSQESLVNEKSLKEMCYTLFFWIYLAVTGLSCGMQVLVPRPRIDPGPPALEGQSPSHWTISKVPGNMLRLCTV